MHLLPFFLSSVQPLIHPCIHLFIHSLPFFPNCLPSIHQSIHLIFLTYTIFIFLSCSFFLSLSFSYSSFCYIFTCLQFLSIHPSIQYIQPFIYSPSFFPSINFFHFSYVHTYVRSFVRSFVCFLSFFLSFFYQCEMSGFGKQVLKNGSMGIYKAYWLSTIACETHTGTYRLIWITPLGRMKSELFVNAQKPPYTHFLIL